MNKKTANLPVPASSCPAPIAGGIAFGVRVTARPHPFKEANEIFWFPPGLSLAEILARVQPDPGLRRSALIWLNNEPMAPEAWESTITEWGAEVVVNVVPEGSAGRMIGTIFIAIAAIAATALTMGAIGPQAYPILAPMLGALAGTAVSIAGNLALNALMPPFSNPQQLANLKGVATDSPTYSLTGASNQANKNGPFPKIYGRFKVFPIYGAEAYTEIVGSDQYLIL